MGTLKEIKYDVCASIWLEPCTFEELCQRLDKTQYPFWSLVKSAIDEKLIYTKNDILYCYKRTAKMLNSNGYELPISTKPVESEFVKSLRKQGLI